MNGNWGGIPSRRSGGSQRRRVVLSAASVVAALVLVGVTRQLVGGSADVYVLAPVAFIAGLLVIGVLWDLRPWVRDR